MRICDFIGEATEYDKKVAVERRKVKVLVLLQTLEAVAYFLV